MLSPEKGSGDHAAEELKACQRAVMSTLTDMISNAMSEASTPLWNVLLSTLKESIKYASSTPAKDDFGKIVAHDMLCRVIAIILTKVQKREYEWEMWPVEMCSAIAKLINLVEEKELLLVPKGEEKGKDGVRVFSQDQILLLCALSDIMKYGRDMTGWCQLVLPTPPEPAGGVDTVSARANESSDYLDFSPPLEDNFNTSRSDHVAINVDSLNGRHLFVPSETPGASSKLLLPVLQPSLRVMLACMTSISSDVKIYISGKEPEAKSLLLHISDELRETMTAAIVGLSFGNARDISLEGMACLRRANLKPQECSRQGGLRGMFETLRYCGRGDSRSVRRRASEA